MKTKVDLDEALQSKRVIRHYRFTQVELATGKTTEHSFDWWTPDMFLWWKQSIEARGFKVIWCRAYHPYLSNNF